MECGDGVQFAVVQPLFLASCVVCEEWPSLNPAPIVMTMERIPNYCQTLESMKHPGIAE